MTGSSQHVFNLIAFLNNMTAFVDEGRAVDAVYLNLRKSFDTVSHKVP